MSAAEPGSLQDGLSGPWSERRVREVFGGMKHNFCYDVREIVNSNVSAVEPLACSPSGAELIVVELVRLGTQLRDGIPRVPLLAITASSRVLSIRRYGLDSPIHAQTQL